MSKEISLSDLGTLSKKSDITPIKTEEPIKSAPKKENTKEVSVDDIAKTLPGKEKEEIKNPIILDNALASVTKTLNERKEFIENHVMPKVEENAMEMAAEKELESLGETNEEHADDIESYNEENEIEMSEVNYNTETDFEYEKEDKIEAPKPKTEKKHVEIPNDDDAFENQKSDLDELMERLDNDFNSNVDDEDDEETEDEMKERFKESLSSIKVVSDQLDLSSFTISQKPISTSNALYNISNSAINNVKKADWVLYHSGRSVTFTECKGPELDNLRKTINNSNNINKVIASLKFVYNHIDDPNKLDFESWTKTIRTEDIESLYFGVYRATYSDSNLIARYCEKDNNKGCGKTSIIDTDINKMTKFKDDETEKKFNEIFNSDTTTHTDKFKSTLIQVSDNLAITCSVPTIYTTFIQFSALNPDIISKYEEYLNTLSYITGFFTIDRENNALVPIAIKEYPNNLNKTVISKLKFYIEALKSLTSDQYNVLIGKLNGLIQTSDISYIYPEHECPECGSIIEESEVDSTLNLLFTRAQLAQIKSL